MTSELRYGDNVTVEELLAQTLEERNTLRQRLLEERLETQKLRERLSKLQRRFDELHRIAEKHIDLSGEEEYEDNN